MTTPVSELLAQRDAVERQIREVRAAAKAQAISEICSLMAAYGLTLHDLSSKSTASNGNTSGGAGRKVAPKYRDPVTGTTWTGRGLKPKWLTAALESGRSVEEFAISSTR